MDALSKSFVSILFFKYILLTSKTKPTNGTNINATISVANFCH